MLGLEVLIEVEGGAQPLQRPHGEPGCCVACLEDGDTLGGQGSVGNLYGRGEIRVVFKIRLIKDRMTVC